jgi:hypothetical protein
MILAASLWAQEEARVARLSQIDGKVSLRAAGGNLWSTAQLNYPLAAGDRLWTDKDSFADVHVGASVLHLAPQTSFAVLNLASQKTQMSLSEGSTSVHIPRMEEGEAFQIDTPNCKITMMRIGAYRVDASPDGDDTIVTVRSGDAQVVAGGQTIPVHTGQMLRIVSTGQVVSELGDAPDMDPWDEWCQSRDELEAHALAASEPYVQPELVGAEDLAIYGAWESDSDYGAVWTPRGMPSDWCPYRFGHWVYKAPWGWTWVDGATWGFAPFHYGHWVLRNGVWAWVPGPRGIRPIYSPAQVAFVNGWGAGFVAWIPLAPREPRGQSAPFANRQWATAVPQNVFTGAEAVSPSRVRGTVANPRPIDRLNLPPRTESFGGRATTPPRGRLQPAAGFSPPAQPSPSNAPVAERRPVEALVDAQEQLRREAAMRGRMAAEQEQLRRQAEAQQQEVQRQQEDYQRRLETQRQDSQRQQEAQRQETQRQQEAYQRQQQESQRQQEAQRQHEAIQRQQEAQRQESQRQEAQRQEAQRQESQRQEAARQESQRQEAQRQEAQRQEAQRQESQRQEAQRQESQRQEAQRQQDSQRHQDTTKKQ